MESPRLASGKGQLYRTIMPQLSYCLLTYSIYGLLCTLMIMFRTHTNPLSVNSPKLLVHSMEEHCATVTDVVNEPKRIAMLVLMPNVGTMKAFIAVGFHVMSEKYDASR